MATDSTDAHGPADARGPGSHTHGASSDADRTKLGIALALIVGFMALEVAAGIIAHSLALLSDAAHMLTDAAAIGLSIFAIHLARRPAEGSMTFGFRRIEILSAQVNGITLLVLAAVIVFEAIQRLITPPEVNGGVMLAVALAGIVVNLAAAWTLARANRQSLNVEGSFRHIVTDLYAFIGTAIAAALILLMGFERADPIASLIVAGLMFHSAYILLRAARPAGRAAGHRIPGMPSILVAEKLDANPELTGPVPPIAEGSVFPTATAIERGETRAEVVGRMQAAMAETLDGLWTKREPRCPRRHPGRRSSSPRSSRRRPARPPNGR